MLHCLVLFDCADHSVEQASNETIAPSFGRRRTLGTEQLVGHQFVDSLVIRVEAGLLEGQREKKPVRIGQNQSVWMCSTHCVGQMSLSSFKQAPSIGIFGLQIISDHEHRLSDHFGLDRQLELACKELR